MQFTHDLKLRNESKLGTLPRWLFSSWCHSVTTSCLRLWSVISFITSIKRLFLFMKKKIREFLFWEIALEKSYLSPSAPHLEICLNDMWASDFLQWHFSILCPCLHLNKKCFCKAIWTSSIVWITGMSEKSTAWYRRTCVLQYNARNINRNLDIKFCSRYWWCTSPFLLAGKGTLSFNKLINKLDRYVSDISNDIIAFNISVSYFLLCMFTIPIIIKTSAS